MSRTNSTVSILVCLTILFSCQRRISERNPEKEQILQFANVHVVDVQQRTVHLNKSIFTRGNKILRIEPQKEGGRVEADSVIDCGGSYVMPSIADLHNHLTPSDFDFGNWTLERQLAIAQEQSKFGIQAVLNPNNSFESSIRYKQLLENDDLCYLYFSGPSLGPEKGWGSHPVKNKDEIENAIDSIHAVGAAFVKITYDDMAWLGGDMPVLDTMLIKHLIEYGHSKGMKVLAHATGAQKVEFLSEKGIDGIIHGVVSSVMDSSALEKMRRNEVIYVPTTVLYETSFDFQRSVIAQFEYDMWNQYSRDIKDSLANNASKQTWNSWWPKAESLRHQMSNVYSNTRLAYDHGVKVMLGSDTGTPGVLPVISTFYEMELLERSGLEPIEVLECAISNPMEFLGITPETGSIEAGKKANMIFLSADPTETVRNVKSTWMIVHEGEIVSLRDRP